MTAPGLHQYLSEYMTPGEFADLPASVHHAVWRAAEEGRVTWVAAAQSLPRRYHREQVLSVARAYLGEQDTTTAAREENGDAIRPA